MENNMGRHMCIALMGLRSDYIPMSRWGIILKIKFICEEYCLVGYNAV
jgi:hypothetical protein